jgi:hypothetical protein
MIHTDTSVGGPTRSEARHVAPTSHQPPPVSAPPETAVIDVLVTKTTADPSVPYNTIDNASSTFSNSVAEPDVFTLILGGICMIPNRCTDVKASS